MSGSNMDNMCPLCSEPTDIFAIGACDHPVCYKCSVRMRVLHEQMYCAICRSDLGKVVFAKKLEKYDRMNTHRFQVNRKFKIFFQDDSVEDAYYSLLDHRCRECPNRKPFRSFSDLKDHLRRDHNLHYCDLCLKYLKLFSAERKAYTRQKLAEHRRVGDEDDKSHKGHPLCKFCDDRYLDNDELVKHLRKDHYFCHFCEADGVTNEFYSEYPLLREHFMDEHYLCEEGDCMDAEFTNAFRDEIDLKSHRAVAHSKNLKRQAARQARAIDIEVNFAREPGGSGRGGARGRNRPDRGSRAGANRGNYQEADHQDDSRRLGPGRSRRAEEQKKREEIETAQAISASLASKSGVNVIDRSLLEPVLGMTNSDDESKSINYQRKVEDFPNLKGETGANKTANAEAENSGSQSSMAKSFARASNFSIQEGSMMEEDFPSLGGKKGHTKGHITKASNPSQGWSFQAQQDDFPSLGGGKKKPANPTGSTSNASWTAVKHTKPQNSSPRKSANIRSMQDFPSLSSIGSGLLSSSTIPGLHVSATPEPSKPNVGAKNAGWSTAPAKGSKKAMKSAAKETQKVKMFEDSDSDSPKPSANQSKSDDFPALGSQNSSSNKAASSWGPKNQKPETTTSVQNEEPFVVLNSKNKKKKKSKKLADVSDSDRGTPGQSDAEERVSSKTSSPKDSPKVKKSGSKPMGSQEGIVQNGVSLEKENQEDKAKKGVSKHNNNGPIVNGVEDFPAVSTLKDRNSVSKALAGDDFPTLGSSQPAAPPPGFGVKKPPPGFNQWTPAGPASKPPPGFSTALTETTDVQPVIENKAPQPATNPGGHIYIKPQNFAPRNVKLIKDIQDLTGNDDDKFKNFKTYSSQFRTNQLSAKEYYQNCSDVIGADKFTDIFTELLSLLPDIDKQQQLLQAHNMAKKSTVKKGRNKGGKKAWGSMDSSFVSCPTCSQVLTSSDLKSHAAEHDLDSDFPAL